MIRQAFMRIPAQLQALAQWVLWKREDRDAKPTKIPITTTGAHASSTDPATWTSFQSALSAYESKAVPDASGIGFVFTETDPYFGIDFDGKAIGAALNPYHVHLAGLLPTYSEISPSGTGLHAIGIGTLPEGWRKKPSLGIEIYDRGRYFTMTGFNGDVDEDVVPCGEQLLTLRRVVDADAETMQLVRRHPKFNKLFTGDLEDYHGDHSSADLAYCCIVGERVRDLADPEGQIDRFVRMSALYREKWMREDYRKVTIAKALNGNGNGRAPSSPPPCPPPSSSPQADPVLTGAEILKRLDEELRRFLVVTPAQRLLISLWIVATYFLDVTDVVPYLNVRGPTKQTGKTLLLEILEHLACRGELCTGASVSSLFRLIEEDKPTLLYDEVDKSMDPKRGNPELLQIFTTGYRRGGNVLRSEVAKGGFVTGRFQTFCFKAFSSIKRLPDELADRSIPINMRRKLKAEITTRAKRKRLRELRPLADEIEKWAQSNAKAIETRYQADGEDPPQLTPRQSDVCELLFCIAAEAGEDYLARSVEASLEVFEASDESEDNLQVAALRDVEIALRHQKALPLTSIVAFLKGLEDSPWRELGDDGLTPRRLTQLLSGFGLPPHGQRKFRHEQKVVTGIRYEWLADALERYRLGPFAPQTVPTGNASNASYTSAQPVAPSGVNPVTKSVTKGVTEGVRVQDADDDGWIDVPRPGEPR